MEFHKEQQDLLGVFHRAISQEEHILTRRPDLLYQQIHNRLTWAQEADELSDEFMKVLAHPHPAPWIKSMFPPIGASNTAKILEGHARPINGCAIDRTGKSALSVGSDGTVRVWDLASSSVSFELDLGSTLYCCDWSPSSEYFATGNRYGTIYLFQTGHGQPVELSGHEDYVLCCAFSPGGDLLLTGSGDRTIRLWSVQTGQEIRRFEGHESGIIQLKFGQDGRTFISTSNDRTVAVWDLESGQKLSSFSEKYLPIQAIAVNKDNQHLLTCGANRMVTLRQYPDLQVVNQMKAPQKGINACEFSPDDRFFAYAGDNDLVIGSLANLEIIATLSGHSKQIKDLAFSPDGKTIITASQDHTLRLWQLNLAENSNQSANVSFQQARFYTPDKNLLTSDDQGRFTFWNTTTGTPEKQLPIQEKGIMDFGFDLTGKLLIACDREKIIRLWNMENDQNVFAIETGGGSPIRAEVLTAQGKILSLSRDWHVRSFDIKTRRAVGEFQADKFRTSLDESKLACTFSGIMSNHTLSLVDITGQKVLAELKGHESTINDFLFTHKGNRLISASDDQTVRIWDCQSFREILTFREHHEDVIALAISPDDSLVLSLDDRGELILWQLDNGAVHHRIHTSLHLHGDCFFSPDMTLFLYGGDSSWVKVHDIKDGKQIAAIPTFAGIEKMELHPFLPQLTGVDANGNLYLYQLNNISYGPIIITPYYFNGGLSFICPACQKSHMLNQQQLGQVIQCPTESCRLPIRLNAFTHKVVLNTQENRKRGLFRRK